MDFLHLLLNLQLKTLLLLQQALKIPSETAKQLIGRGLVSVAGFSIPQILLKNNQVPLALLQLILLGKKGLI